MNIISPKYTFKKLPEFQTPKIIEPTLFWMNCWVDLWMLKNKKENVELKDKDESLHKHFKTCTNMLSKIEEREQG